MISRRASASRRGPPLFLQEDITMDLFASALAENPLRSRQDAVRLLLDMIRPLRRFYSPRGALLHVGSSGTSYSEKSARMEGWARVLWGLGPLLGADNSQLPEAMQSEIQHWGRLYCRGLVEGTNPESPEYWGDIVDFEQKMCEVAPLAIALCLAPSVLWDPLSDAEKHRVWAWLDGMNHCGVHPNNWRFFRVLTNMAFARLHLPYDRARLEEDFASIERCYLDGGWYYDGKPGQIDYYIAFAFHYYGLLWVALSRDVDPQPKELLCQRAQAFAKDFAQWFSDDGAEIPFGRSLTYRFAHSCFFAALALAGNPGESLPWGVVRHTLLANLHSWMQWPIIDPAGLLSIGYRYPDLFMSENYNAPGSPYWALKSFIFLWLPADHPFWQAPDADLPRARQLLQPTPRMLLCHDDHGGVDHLTCFPAGHHCQNHGNVAAKYEKFVYSNRFGFSVSRGNTLEEGAFDCTLAAAPAGSNCYRMRYGQDAWRQDDQVVYTRYDLWPFAHVCSWVIPCGGPWHLRIHLIRTEQPLDVADGGFTLPFEEPFAMHPGREDGRLLPRMSETYENGAGAFLPWGAVGALTLYGPCAGRMVHTFPNTNLFFDRCAMPVLTASLNAGEHLLVHAFFGDLTADARDRFAAPPAARVEGTLVTVTTCDGRTLTVDTADCP